MSESWLGPQHLEKRWFFDGLLHPHLGAWERFYGCALGTQGTEAGGEAQCW